MTLQDYIKKYESKTKLKFEPNKSFELLFSPERGFCEICAADQSIFVWQLCGDVRWWFDAVIDTVKKMNLKNIVTHIVRPVRPFIRIFGYKIDRIDTAGDGTQRFICSDKTGRSMVAMTMINEDNKYVGAIIIWEVN